MFGSERGLFRRNTPPAERILPSDVRYALKYREAQLGPSEILDLVRNGFEQEALYMTLKAQVEDPDSQKAHLQKTLELVVALPEEGRANVLREGLRAQLESLVPTLSPDQKVVGMKLAQLSRQGFDVWHERYDTAAAKYASDPDQTFIVGHSMFVGLPAFLMYHHAKKKPLHVLMPDFIEAPAREFCGYRIEENTVSFLPRDFDRDGHAVVIDDVQNTGETENLLRTFWTHEGANDPPRFEFLARSGSV